MGYHNDSTTISADGKGPWRRLDETEDSGGDDHTLRCNPIKIALPVFVPA
jgi:hypothetical protein